MSFQFRSIRVAIRAAGLVFSLSLSGCFLIAAGAGAGATVAYTNRGASSDVKGGVNATFDRAVTTFSDMHIAETGRGTEDSGDTRRLVGKKDDYEVTVEMKRSGSDVTKVEVIARKNLVDYDKDMARSVLNGIIAAK